MQATPMQLAKIRYKGLELLGRLTERYGEPHSYEGWDSAIRWARNRMHRARNVARYLAMQYHLAEAIQALGDRSHDDPVDDHALRAELDDEVLARLTQTQDAVWKAALAHYMQAVPIVVACEWAGEPFVAPHRMKRTLAVADEFKALMREASRRHPVWLPVERFIDEPGFLLLEGLPPAQRERWGWWGTDTTLVEYLDQPSPWMGVP